MSQEMLLGVLLAASALAIATVVGWFGAALAGLAIDRWGRYPAAHRARHLAHARLLPLTLPAVLVPAQIVAFVRFEAGGDESPGLLLLGLAAAGVVLFGSAIRSGYRALRGTRAVARRWRQSAVALAVPGWVHRAWLIRRRYPIVAIVGLVRPQLFVASQVADVCTRDELAAIAAHERAHVRAGDNLLRWLFSVTPGAGVFAPVGARLERAWVAAAEEAADAVARRQASSLDLASALTKVARLATGRAPDTVASSALIGGSDLRTRVERLLAPPAPERVSRLDRLPVASALTVAALLQTTPVASALHQLFELLVRR